MVETSLSTDCTIGFERDLRNIFILLNTLNKPHPMWLIRCYQAFMSLNIMISKSSLALSAQIHVTRLSAYSLWLIKLSPHFCSCTVGLAKNSIIQARVFVHPSSTEKLIWDLQPKPCFYSVKVITTRHLASHDVIYIWSSWGWKSTKPILWGSRSRSNFTVLELFF